MAQHLLKHLERDLPLSWGPRGPLCRSGVQYVDEVIPPARRLHLPLCCKRSVQATQREFGGGFLNERDAARVVLLVSDGPEGPGWGCCYVGPCVTLGAESA